MIFLIFGIVAIVCCILSKVIWPNQITWKEMGLQLGGSLLLSAVVLAISYFSDVSDYETHFGEVTNKTRKNDSHLESYSCNCRTTSSGSGKNKTTSTKCDTCWRTIYTVDWWLDSTIGHISISSEDSRSQSVWLTPDPESYVNARVGEPCAKTSMFKNYIKAAKGSLFNTEKYAVTATLPVPQYPTTHSIYKIQSVLSVGALIDTTTWDTMLQEKLKTLAAQKQVNVVILIANTPDQTYKYKVEKEWLGGKKNDYVVILGTTDNKTISWVDGFTFGLSQGNFLMLSEVASEVVGKELKPEVIIPTITKHVEEKFTRKQMKDFEYLTREIEPSGVAIGFLVMLQLVFNIGITFYNIKHDYL